MDDGHRNNTQAHDVGLDIDGMAYIHTVPSAAEGVLHNSHGDDVPAVG